MLRNFLKHAENQKPLVSHAWAITTSKINSPFDYYFADKEGEEGGGGEEVATFLPDRSCDIRSYTSLGKYWISNLFPVKRVFLNPQGVFPEVYSAFMNKRLPGLLDTISKRFENDIQILSYEPFYRDGGAVVEIGTKSARGENDKEKIIKEIQNELQYREFRAPLTINFIGLYSVKGTPWIHDLYAPTPGTSLDLEIYSKEVVADPVIEQNLYQLFRPFGKILHMSLNDRSMKDNKPLTYRIRYKKLPSAIAARACLHQANYFELLGKESPSPSNDHGKLILSYYWYPTGNIFTNAYNKHSKLFAVAVGLSIALLSYTIVDPMRKFFVWLKLTRKTNLMAKKSQKSHPGLFDYYSLLGFFGLSQLFPRAQLPIHIDLPHNAEKKLEQYLKRDPVSILYLTGPSGTGKSQLARKAVSSYQPNNSLFVDFEELLQITDEEEFIRALAKKIGFFPSFAGIEAVGSILDAITPGAGRATMASTQTKSQKIFKTLASVLHYMASGSDEIPLIVIDGFTDTNQAKHSVFIKTILQCLELWVQLKIARVVFVADITFEATGGLSSLLPNSKIEKLIFKDISFDSSLELIRQKLVVKVDEKELSDAVKVIGGRLGDMNTFLGRINSGQNPLQAVESIVDGAKDDIKNILFEHKKTNGIYTIAQLWKVISILAETPEVSYDYILFSVFKGDDKALRSLIHTKLLSMGENVSTNVESIQAGSPVIQKAFFDIFSDSLLRPGMDLFVARSALSAENDLIKSYESELTQIKLSGMVDEPALAQRISYLLAKYASCQKRIEAYEDTIENNTTFLKNA